MRLGATTRPAPHHYVEALIKKISYPRLEGFLNFGKICDYNNYTGLPIALTIHNLSKLINEKNIEYRIIASGCDIMPINEIPQNINLKFSTDIIKKAKDILHYNMPFYGEYFLITNRMMPRSNPILCDINIIFWGELSPIVSSSYKLKMLGDRYGTICEIDDCNENIYLHENPKNMELNEIDRLKKSREMLMQEFQNKISRMTIFNHL
jgi:hypothetical protein